MEALAAFEVQAALVEVHAHDARVEPHVDAVLAVEAFVVDQDVAGVLAACEQPFREGRALIREEGVLRDDR